MIDGKRLRALRKRQKMTAEELGKYLEVSGQQVLRYETGQSDMTTETLIKIADFLDVSTDYLLGRADNPNPYEYRSRPLTWSVETTRLLNAFQPEFAARVVRSFGLQVRLEPEAVSVSQLLKDNPPEKVAIFLRALGLRDSVIDDAPDT